MQLYLLHQQSIYQRQQQEHTELSINRLATDLSPDLMSWMINTQQKLFPGGPLPLALDSSLVEQLQRRSRAAAGRGGGGSSSLETALGGEDEGDMEEDASATTTGHSSRLVKALIKIIYK